MRLSFFIFIYLSGIHLICGQSSKIVKKGDFIYLKDPQQGFVDTLHSSLRLRYSKDKDTLLVYGYHKLVLPDNCPSFLFSETRYLIREKHFLPLTTHTIVLGNADCGSFFYDVYCLNIYKAKISRQHLVLYGKDLKKYTLRNSIPFPRKEQLISSLRDQLDRTISKPSCIEVTLESEEDQE